MDLKSKLIAIFAKKGQFYLSLRIKPSVVVVPFFTSPAPAVQPKQILSWGRKSEDGGGCDLLVPVKHKKNGVSPHIRHRQEDLISQEDKRRHTE